MAPLSTPAVLVGGIERVLMVARPSPSSSMPTLWTTRPSRVSRSKNPVQAFSIQSENLVIDGVTIDNSDGDDNGGHNTDGFDISESTGVTIKDAVVENQDDCIAINSGEIYLNEPR